MTRLASQRRTHAVTAVPVNVAVHTVSGVEVLHFFLSSYSCVPKQFAQEHSQRIGRDSVRQKIHLSCITTWRSKFFDAKKLLLKIFMRIDLRQRPQFDG